MDRKIARLGALLAPMVMALVAATCGTAIAAAEPFTRTGTVAGSLLDTASTTIFALAAPAAIAIAAFGLMKGMLLSTKGPKGMEEGMKIFKNTIVSFALLMILVGVVHLVGSSASEIADQLGR